MKILLIAYDNGQHVSFFPHSIAYIAAACRKAGHDVRVYNQDVYHWDESHLTDTLNKEHFEVVGLGACGGYYQYRKAIKISEAIDKARRRPVYLLGGHLASPEPKYFLRKMKADIAVIGEGEETAIELLNAIENKKPLSEVKGIAFMEGEKCIQTPRRPAIEDVDSIPFPAWDMVPMEHYVLAKVPNIRAGERYMTVLSGRGCTFNCNFCYRMDKGFRPRSPEGITEEIKRLKKDYGISYIGFNDELLMSSCERTIDICKSFIRNKLSIRWGCSGRLNYAKPDALKLMKESGCVFINYGIESLDDKTLKVMNKALTADMIHAGIKNTLAAGISPGFNIIFGNIGETAESLEKGVQFLLKYDDHAQIRTIRPVTPYPGSPLYYYAVEQGLLKDCEDFYENKHTNSDLLSVNFTDLSEGEFYQALYKANIQLLENYYLHQMDQAKDNVKSLYFKKDASFRGFRQI